MKKTLNIILVSSIIILSSYILLISIDHAIAKCEAQQVNVRECVNI